MTIEKENYVSFETAKLLKEKGFDWPCRARYGLSGYLYYEKYPIEASGCEMHNCILAPTVQMARNWLETEYRFLFVIYHSLETGNLRFSWRIYQLQPDKRHYVEELKGIGEYYVDGNDCNSHEECCEDAIKFCLENLI